ncbi:MAG: hypothetical protein ABSE46_19585 [Terracidiphilus sp.]|jgi:hypothetical protein
MPRIALHLILLSVFFLSAVGFSPAQTASDRSAALNAATAWIALVDAKDWSGAAHGYSPEALAALHSPTPEQALQGLAAYLAIQHFSQDSDPHEVTRKPQADGVKRVTACNCGIPNGDFFEITYDVKYKFVRMHMAGHIPYYRQGTEVLYMMHEKSGAWKPAALVMHVGGPTNS